MKWEKKLEKPSEPSPGKRKSKIVRYVFIATIVLSMAFSALSSWAGLDASSSQAFCARKALTYQAQWYEMHSTLDDYVCVWTPMFYVLIVYLFFVAFLPMQIITAIVWIVSRFVSKKQNRSQQSWRDRSE